MCLTTLVFVSFLAIQIEAIPRSIAMTNKNELLSKFGGDENSFHGNDGQQTSDRPSKYNFKEGRFEPQVTAFHFNPKLPKSKDTVPNVRLCRKHSPLPSIRRKLCPILMTDQEGDLSFQLPREGDLSFLFPVTGALNFQFS